VTLPASWGNQSEWNRETKRQFANLERRLAATGTLSVKDAPFNAVGDGIADDTAAFDAAVAALILRGGGKLFVPFGTYKITSVIGIDSPYSIQVEGEGRNSTIIVQHTMSEGIFIFGSPFSGFSCMRLQYNGTPALGATVASFTANGSYGHCTDFLIANCYVGVQTSGVATKLTQFDILDYESAGVLITANNDVFISQFIMNAGNTARGVLGGIRLEDKAEAVTVTDGDIILGAYSMTATAASNTLGMRPAYNKFTNVYFDSSANGVSIDKSVDFDFLNCWFSNRPGNGCSLSNTDGIKFSNGGAMGSGSNGVEVAATCKRTTFSNFAAIENGNTTPNNFHGIAIAAGTTDFSIMGCQLGGNLFGFNSQRYGVFVAGGASDRYNIIGNLVSGNLAGGVSDNGTGVNKTVASNY
jgi:hypothetical protein